MTLSDKRFDSRGVRIEKEGINLYFEKDVKEAINQIKEKIWASKSIKDVYSPKKDGIFDILEEVLGEELCK